MIGKSCFTVSNCALVFLFQFLRVQMWQFHIFWHSLRSKCPFYPIIFAYPFSWMRSHMLFECLRFSVNFPTFCTYVFSIPLGPSVRFLLAILVCRIDIFALFFLWRFPSFYLQIKYNLHKFLFRPPIKILQEILKALKVLEGIRVLSFRIADQTSIGFKIGLVEFTFFLAGLLQSPPSSSDGVSYSKSSFSISKSVSPSTTKNNIHEWSVFVAILLTVCNITTINEQKTFRG